MKKLLFKIVVLAILVGITNILLRNFYYNRLTPYYWGNEMLTQKRNYLYNNKDSVNVLFLGSSKVLNQIAPNLFDSILRANGQQINSFNFGVPSMLPAESFYMVENLIKKDSINPQYILMELAWFDITDLPNLFTRRSYYWLDLNYTMFSERAVLTSRNPLKIKLWNTISKVISLIQKEYNINLFEELFKYKFAENDNSKMNEDRLVRLKGFWPTKIPKYSLNKSQLHLLNESKNGSISAFTNKANIKTSYNSIYLQKVNELIELTAAKKIHLIFFLPPLWKKYQYDEMVPLFNQLNYKHKIILGNYFEHPEFYAKENMHNSSHLNFIGAALYTKILAREFLSIKKNIDSAR